MRGLAARCLMAQADIAHLVGDQSCLVTAWEAEMMAFADGAVSEATDAEVPPLLADDTGLRAAYLNGREKRSNTEGFARDGCWYWRCYQCSSCDYNGESVRDGLCTNCASEEEAAATQDLHDQLMSALLP
ncbi:hypothetical protein SAMN05421547_10839 [Delftia lacustris]|uniref:Uncharacterized protein n=2 Tax=Delftia lacustris TaxID=558537 RepID=A0A1H3MVI0_9BURK|nr:hypothetical protein SAMN05421547_10839 [Delftia lacustris]